MPRIDLTEKQSDMLCAILYSYLSDLRLEIVDTERKSWRDRMKEEETFIRDLLEMLGDSPARQLHTNDLRGNMQ